MKGAPDSRTERAGRKRKSGDRDRGKKVVSRHFRSASLCLRSDGAISAGRATYPGIVTDRGPEGCNIVTAWALVSAPAADPAPPFGPRHPDPYRESCHRPLRHLPVAGRRSTIALGGAAIIDYPRRKSGTTRPSQRLRLSLTEHFLSYLYNAMPGFASNSYPLSPFYKRSWFSKLGNGHFDFPRAGAVSPAVLFPKDRDATLLRRRRWCGGSGGSAFGAVPTEIKAIRLGADLMHIIWFCAVPRRRAR
jgi:hypothetical protein